MRWKEKRALARRQKDILSRLTARRIWWIHAGDGLSVLGDPLPFGMHMDPCLVLVVPPLPPIVAVLLEERIEQLPGIKGIVAGDRLIANEQLKKALEPSEPS